MDDSPCGRCGGTVEAAYRPGTLCEDCLVDTRSKWWPSKPAPDYKMIVIAGVSLLLPKQEETNV
jgi:hypothetical protein